MGGNFANEPENDAHWTVIKAHSPLVDCLCFTNLLFSMNYKYITVIRWLPCNEFPLFNSN